MCCFILTVHKCCCYHTKKKDKVIRLTSNQHKRQWTREETIIVLSLYCRIPFSQSNASHPEIRKVAELIGRTPASVNLKVGNFGSFDSELKKRGIVGLSHASKLDRQVWDEFNGSWEQLAQESAQLVNKAETKQKTRIGADRMAYSKQRVNQQFFRETILASYDKRCCITGLAISELLVASHIKPWAKCSSEEKLNPRNGLCLNVLHDRAFDRGLVTVEEDLRLKISPILLDSPDTASRKMLLHYNNHKISLPEKFVPDQNFLAWHREHCFHN